MNTPSHPASDTVIGDAERGWYSYGPRVMVSDVDVDIPKPGEAPQFWGIYRWVLGEGQWHWILDVSRKARARALVRNLLINPEYTPEPEDITA